jgi:uncharacterized protein (TIGR02284 family)
MNEYPELTGLLDRLITTLKDGQKGYEEAAKDVEAESLRSLFSELSDQRAQLAQELQTLDRSLGKTQPETEGSVAGSVHRDWIELRSALAAKNGPAILAECERGDCSAVEDFTKALEGDLPIQLRVVISSQLEVIRTARERIRVLREECQES